MMNSAEIMLGKIGRLVSIMTTEVQYLNKDPDFITEESLFA